MTQISSIQPKFSSIDALWALFQAQSDSMRHAFIQRLLKEESAVIHKESHETTATEIDRMDSLLYGSVHLPKDFDYEKELNTSLSSKYSL